MRHSFHARHESPAPQSALSRGVRAQQKQTPVALRPTPAAVPSPAKVGATLPVLVCAVVSGAFLGGIRLSVRVCLPSSRFSGRRYNGGERGGLETACDFHDRRQVLNPLPSCGSPGTARTALGAFCGCYRGRCHVGSLQRRQPPRVGFGSQFQPLYRQQLHREEEGAHTGEGKREWRK